MNNQASNNSIKNPRINWKYILIAVVLAVIVGGIVLLFLVLPIPLPWQPSLSARCSECKARFISYCEECRLLGWPYDFEKSPNFNLFDCMSDCFGKKFVRTVSCGWIKNMCIEFGVSEEKEVSIATDKTEYEQGETIKIVLRNNLDKSIFYKDFRDITCAGTSFSLGKKENEEYKNFHPLGTEKCIEPTVELEPNSEKIYYLNLPILKERNWDGIYNIELLGIFKLQLSYSFGEIKHEELEEAVYSNKFTIKEKEDETANWKTYKNEEYGFSFKYPDKIDLGKGLTQLVVKENLNPIDAIFVAYIEKPFTIGFQVLEKPQEFSNLKNYVETITENINKGPGGAAPISAEFNEFTINGIKGFAIKTTAADVLGNTSVEIYFEKLIHLLVIRYSYSETLLGEQDLLESSKYNTVQKIISTFRFLE